MRDKAEQTLCEAAHDWSTLPGGSKSLKKRELALYVSALEYVKATGLRTSHVGDEIGFRTWEEILDAMIEEAKERLPV